MNQIKNRSIESKIFTSFNNTTKKLFSQTDTFYDRLQCPPLRHFPTPIAADPKGQNKTLKATTVWEPPRIKESKIHPPLDHFAYVYERRSSLGGGNSGRVSSAFRHANFPMLPMDYGGGQGWIMGCRPAPFHPKKD